MILKKTFVTSVGILSVVALALSGLGQESAATKPRFAGYVRPGDPSDEVLAKSKDFAGKIIGATIYVGIYDRLADTGAGDTFGTGMTGFDDKFTVGAGSKVLDKTAKCLYLYQIVNDRGMADLEVPGLKQKTEDVASFRIKLPPNADITSWGYFTKTGFRAGVKDKKSPMAISAAAAIESQLTNKTFGKPADASKAVTPIDFDIASFGTGSSILNLTDSATYEKLMAKKKDNKALPDGGENFLAAAQTTMGEPAEVEFIDRTVPGESEFRVKWKDAIKQGQHSVLIGFTSKFAPPSTGTNQQASVSATADFSDTRIADTVLPAPLSRPFTAPGLAQTAELVPNKGKQPLVAGFTLPGSRSDYEVNGEVKPMALRSISGDPISKKVIGGRILVTVYERNEKAGAADLDPWNTGSDDLVGSLQSGLRLHG